MLYLSFICLIIFWGACIMNPEMSAWKVKFYKVKFFICTCMRVAATKKLVFSFWNKQKSNHFSINKCITLLSLDCLLTNITGTNILRVLQLTIRVEALFSVQPCKSSTPAELMRFTHPSMTVRAYQWYSLI